MRFQCTNCNFKFEPRADKVPHKCPYCDKDGAMQQAKSMQDFIDEVSGDTEDERP